MPEPGVLKIRMFGGLEVLFDGQRLAFPTRHSGLILAILALEPHMRMSRDQLAHILWDTRGEVQSRASLRQALYHIRRTLTHAGAQELTTDHGHIALPESAQSDVAQVFGTLKTDPQKAATDFGGSILPGIGGFGPAFDDWLQETRRNAAARAQSAFHKALSEDRQSASARQDLAEAILRIDRFDEAALRHAMRAYADLDRRGTAIQLFESTRTAMLADLNLDLEEATKALAEAIAVEEPPAKTVSPDSHPATPAGTRRSVSAVFLVVEAAEDPEDFEDEMTALAERLSRCLDSEAYVAPAGPAVACIFGLKQPTERHTEIALNAYLTLKDSGIMAPAAIVVGELVTESAQAEPDLSHLLAPAMALAHRAGPGKAMLSSAAAKRLSNLASEVLGEVAADIIGLPATLPRPAPFIGRQPDVAKLEESFAQVGATGGRLVAIVGEAGIGKTTLVRQFLETRVPASTTVLRIQAAEASASRPFGVLGDLFFGVPQLPEIVAHVLGQDGADTDEWSNIPAAVRRRKLVDAVLARIQDAACGAPAVLVLEDLHWIDPETDALLHGVINHLSNLPLLIVATHRPEYSGGWVGRSFFRLLQLAPLKEADARRLLAEVAPEASKPRQDELLRRAAGIPYFVVELARGQSNPTLNSGLPSSIRDLLSAHLMRLPGSQLKLLQAASVLGPEFRRDVLGQVALVEDFDDVLAELIGGEHLIPLPGLGEQHYRFKHALLHEATYGSILRDDRSGLHSQVLDVLRQSLSGPPGGSAEAEMAEHAWHAQAWPEAAELLTRVGDRYAELSSYGLAREAYERARHALEATPDDSGYLRARLGLALRLRPVLVPLGAYEDAKAELNMADTLATSMGQPDELAKVLIGKSYLFSTHGRLQEAAETAQRAIDLPEENSQLYHEAHLALGQALSLAADWRGTEDALLPSLEFWDAHPHERFGHTGTRAIWCYGMLANARARKGDQHKAQIYADHALVLARETERPLDQVFALQRVADAKRLAGWNAEVLALLEDSYQRAQDVDAPIFQVWFACDLAAGYIALERLNDAHGLLNRQARIAEQLELRQFKAWIDFRRGELACAEGNFEEASQYVGAALDAAEKIGDRALEVACHKVRATRLPNLPPNDRSLVLAEKLEQKYDLWAGD